MVRKTDAGDREHFKRWTAEQRVPLTTRQAMWRLFASDPDYWGDQGWGSVLRAVEINVGREKNPGAARHSAAWDHCVEQVRKKGTAVSPYAVCTASLKELSYRGKNPVRDPEHRKLLKQLSQHFSSDEAMLAHMKRGNPLVRSVKYLVSATRGRKVLWLTPDSRLSASQTRAQRFTRVSDARLAAEGHLAEFPSSRAYTFQVRLGHA